jgi:hypothetical protein
VYVFLEGGGTGNNDTKLDSCGGCNHSIFRYCVLVAVCLGNSISFRALWGKGFDNALESDYPEINRGRFNKSLLHWNSFRFGQHTLKEMFRLDHIHHVL